MSPLEFLQQRVSVTKLQAPVPDQEILNQVFKAALRAPDHGKLSPSRFLVIQGDGLVALSELFVAATLRANPQVSPALIDKARAMPSRAPMIIAAIAKQIDHPKIPRQEMLLSCGAAVQNLLNALFVLGFGAVWRTGELAYDRFVLEALGVAADESFIGYIYVGTPVQPLPNPPEVDPSAFFSHWPAV